MLPLGGVSFRFLIGSFIICPVPHCQTLFFPVSVLPLGIFVCLWVISCFICSAPAHLRILTARSSDPIFRQQIPSSSTIRYKHHKVERKGTGSARLTVMLT